MIIIGISGKMGTGKNYISDNYVVPQFINYYQKKNPERILVPYYYSFGTGVKIELYGRNKSLNFHNLFIDKKTTRNIIREYATNIKKNYDDDIWIREIDLQMQIQTKQLSLLNNKNYVPLFIIQDVRFPNEYEFIKKKTSDHILIRVEAFDRNDIRIKHENIDPNHISEIALDNIIFPYTIYNNISNVHTVERQVISIMNHLFATKNP